MHRGGGASCGESEWLLSGQPADQGDTARDSPTGWTRHRRPAPRGEQPLQAMAPPPLPLPGLAVPQKVRNRSPGDLAPTQQLTHLSAKRQVLRGTKAEGADSRVTRQALWCERFEAQARPQAREGGREPTTNSTCFPAPVTNSCPACDDKGEPHSPDRTTRGPGQPGHGWAQVPAGNRLQG